MKSYYLKLTNDDLTIVDSVFRSELIDLYDNSSYRNYSTTKSAYGLELLDNRVWVGLEQKSPTETDAGIIDDGRFIDYTGKVYIINYDVVVVSRNQDRLFSPYLTVYGGETDNEYFPDDYSIKSNLMPGGFLIDDNPSRYCIFELSFDEEEILEDIEFELYIRIDIDSPVIAPEFRTTRRILNKFPEWTEFYKDADAPATPELATPDSVGGGFINSMAGKWLEDIEYFVDKYGIEQFITTADINQVYQTFETSDVPKFVVEVVGDGIVLARSASLSEYFELTESEDAFYWNIDNSKIYCNKIYESFTINGIEYPQSRQPIWNWFDEFGMLVNLERLPNETNKRYKDRILDVYKNKPGVSKRAFQLALRRELDLWYEYGATPSSDYAGATPEVLEVSDIENDVYGATPYMNFDGTATDRFKTLASTLKQQFPILWGYFKWDDAYWDSTGLNNEAIGYLPHIFDASPSTGAIFQPGVGDVDDLFVLKPSIPHGPTDFEADIQVRGKYKEYRTEYPKLTLSFDFVASADRVIHYNPVVEENFVLQFIIDGETYSHNFTLSAAADVSFDSATPTDDAIAFATNIGRDGRFDIGDIVYHNASGVATTITEDNIENFNLLTAVDEDTDFTFQLGTYDPDTQTIIDTTTDLAIAIGWIDNEIADLVESPWVSIRPQEDGFVLPIMQSRQYASYVDRWESEPIPFSVSFNGSGALLAAENFDLAVPQIEWPTNLEDPANIEYKLIVTSVNESGEPCASFKSVDTFIKFLDIDRVGVNGDYGWSDGELIITNAPSVLTFSSISSASPEYPEVNGFTWKIFSETLDGAIAGTVDENGAWKNQVRPEAGANTYLLESLSLNRDDFGIANSDDYIITWIGASSANYNVEVWLSSNTVKSEANVLDGLNYGDSYIEEKYDAVNDVYYLDDFNVFCRLKTQPDPHWYPEVHSGFAYLNDSEYYMYTDHATAITDDYEKVLDSLAYQGAPIIVVTDHATPQQFRQVAFHDSTPNFTLTNTEYINGSGTDSLFVGYPEIYDIVVYNETLGVYVDADETCGTNEIKTADVTDRSHSFRVSYRVKNSFYAEHDYKTEDGLQRTKLTFDRHPTEVDASTYHITYESSAFDEATPIDLPLNSYYTIADDSFIYVSLNEYDLARVEVKIGATHLKASDDEFVIVSIRAFDVNGNPKPNAHFNLATTFGTLADNELTTNDDGYACTFLECEAEMPENYKATIDITGDLETSVTMFVVPSYEAGYRLIAVPSSELVQADGLSNVAIFGKVTQPDQMPAANSVVRYRKARTINDVFELPESDLVIPEEATPIWGDSGRVIANSDGEFEIGPFRSATPMDPGYWFMAIESQGATPIGEMGATPGQDNGPAWDRVGDIVFWYEYPETIYGTDALTRQPMPTVQKSTPQYIPPRATPTWGYEEDIDDPPDLTIHEKVCVYPQWVQSYPGPMRMVGTAETDIFTALMYQTNCMRKRYEDI